MATTGFSSYEMDPATGLPKQKKASPQLPYLDNTGQNYLPLAPQATQTQQANQTFQPGMFTPQGLEQGNAQVMGAAQQAALNQGAPQSAIQAKAQQMTQEQMNNPGFGYNPATYKANAMSNFDLNRAGAVKAFKEENAPLAGSGTTQENLLKAMLAGNIDRSNLENQYDMQAVDRQKQDWIDALTQGRTQTGSDQAATKAAIDNLLGVRAGYEGERAQTTGNEQQMAVLDKTYGQDLAKMVASQDWQGGQNQLDREAAVLAQSTDINAKNAFADKQQAFDMAKLSATNDFTAVQADIDRRQAIALQGNDIETKKYLADLQIKADSAQLQKTQDFTAVQNDISNKWKSTENSLDRDTQNSIIERQIALDKWKQTTGQEFTATQNALSRSLETSLKTMDIDGQKVLMNLKADIDFCILKQTQDFEGAQKEADRALQTAMQKNDIQAQQAAIVLKGQIDQAAQTAQNEWNNTERIATQGWQTSERIDQNGFEKAMQYIKQETETALQNNDFSHQQSLSNDKAALELKMQTQSMTHDESMATLNANLAEAKANNDVERQAQIINFQTASDLETMTAKYGFDSALQNSQYEYQRKMQAGDFEQAKQMLLTQQTFQANENVKDRALEQARIALQDKGVNLQAMQAEYEAAAKLGDNQGAAAILNKYLVNAGLEGQQIHVANPTEAIQADFEAQQYQFLQTHPEYGNVDNGTTSLTPEGAKAFNEWFNTTTYGNAKTITDIVSDINNTYGGKDKPNTPEGQAYKSVLSRAQEWKPELVWNGSQDSTHKFGNVPALNTPILYKGNLYVVTSGVGRQKVNDNETQFFTMIDPNNGKTVSVNAFKPF
jgi:hypothetical protein